MRERDPRLGADTLCVKNAPRINKLMTQGIAHHVAGRLVEAAARYSQVAELRPAHGDAWRLLGVVALQRGDTAARGLLERAIRTNPADASARSALGAVEESQGAYEAAYSAYMAARSLDPMDTAAAIGLTRVALRLGRAAEAIAVGEATLANGTTDPGLLRALGGARLLVREYRGAADALEASLRSTPHADTYAYLAGAYIHLNEADAAISAAQSALSLDAAHAVAALHLAIALLMRGTLVPAVAAFEQAIELGSEAAHLKFGTLLLKLGEYQRGWEHLGWIHPTRRANPAFTALPMWDGTMPVRHLLVWHEQGLGDTIQMARFLPQVRALVGSITLACAPEAIDLLAAADGVDTVLDMNAPGSLAAFDAWLPTIRLPLVLGITPQTIPDAPYLRADPARIERFLPMLDVPGRLRVGLVWSGNPENPCNDERSCGLGELEALNDVPGVAWFALQQGTARTDEPTSAMELIPINAHVTDLADTAALIAQLDLVITVDTSVANLAGALGRPAWVLLGRHADWRWGPTGEISPWYPTLRLFRRSDDGPWSAVIAAVAAELRELLAQRG